MTVYVLYDFNQEICKQIKNNAVHLIMPIDLCHTTIDSGLMRYPHTESPQDTNHPSQPAVLRTQLPVRAQLHRYQDHYYCTTALNNSGGCIEHGIYME